MAHRGLAELRNDALGLDLARREDIERAIDGLSRDGQISREEQADMRAFLRKHS